MKKFLWMMVGIPGCGKSTWIEKQLALNGGTCISRDKIRYSLLLPYEDYFSKEDKVFEQFIQEIQTAIYNTEINPNIYIDATHLNEASREKVLSKLDLSCVEKIFLVHFVVPFEVAAARNQERVGRAKVPVGQIRRMYFQKDIPKAGGKFKYNIIDINENGEQTNFYSET